MNIILKIIAYIFLLAGILCGIPVVAIIFSGIENGFILTFIGACIVGLLLLIASLINKYANAKIEEARIKPTKMVFVELTLSPIRGLIIVVTFGCISYLFFSWTALPDDSQIIFWRSVIGAICGLISLLFLRVLILKKPALIINEIGIERIGPFPKLQKSKSAKWSEIGHIERKQLLLPGAAPIMMTFALIYPRHNFKTPIPMGKPIEINVGGLTMSPNEIIQIIQDNLAIYDQNN